MDRSTLKVFLRAKGQLDSSSITLTKDLHGITVSDPLNKDPAQTFEYYRIFAEASQEEVFETTSRHIIEHVLDGFDSLIIAYGATGSGKSHTILGSEIDPGIYYRTAQCILEEADKISSQKKIDLSITIVELYENSIRDLGLAYKDPRAIAVFTNQQLDISEINGRICVHQATEIPVKTLAEATGVIQQVHDMRAALEAKQGRYVDKAHTIVSFKVRQRYIASAWDQSSESILYLVELPGSEKPKQRKGQEFNESLNPSGSFHALAKCLSNLNSVATHYTDHKITRILEHSFKNNSMISMIGTVEIAKEHNEETLRTLGYIDKCKATAFNVQFGESSNADFTIKHLQNERATLKDKLKRLETTQEEQLKKIVEILGVDTDIDTLLEATQGSKELLKIASQKDAVNRVEALSRRNREIEKRVEENKKVLEKIKKIDFQTQEKHLRQVLEIKDELNRFKDMLEECKASHDYNTKSQVQTKTIELNDMLANSQKLLDEKLTIINKLPQSITSSIKLPEHQEIMEIGKKETEKEYKYRLSELERDCSKHYEATKKKFEMHLEQREQAIASISQEINTFKAQKDKDMDALNKEVKQLFEIVKAQKSVLNHIQSGEYNQRLSIVNFPETIIPEFPSQKTFPQ